METSIALAKMQNHAHIYDPAILAALLGNIEATPEQQLKEVRVPALTEDMTLAQNIYTHSGMLLARKGQPVSDSLCERLINFYRDGNIDVIINVTM